ncbi:hypothetical protein ON010_g18624 [Phytophthora cinnamomi]|nr:hypothetical protein ON010_g18624 [Phytophthora cinnamomi]
MALKDSGVDFIATEQGDLHEILLGAVMIEAVSQAVRSVNGIITFQDAKALSRFSLSGVSGDIRRSQVIPDLNIAM